MNLKKLNQPLLWTAFSFYLIILIWIIGFKFNAAWLPEVGDYMRELSLWERVGMRIIPFYRMITEGWYFDYDYFMNVIIYLPMGIYLFLVLKPRRRLPISLAIIFFSSFLFEFVQLVTGFGGCDGSDLLCNTWGGILGYLLCALLFRRLPAAVINLINAAVILLAAYPVGYAVINTLLHTELYRIS